MPRAINRDADLFRKVISGKIHKKLQRFISSGKFTRLRAKNGKTIITLPNLDTPHIVYGDPADGIGRGPGKKGDVVRKDPQPGDSDVGDEGGEGILVSIDIEEILLSMQDELCLPDLKPKSEHTFEEVDIKYNDISLVGPQSLRHGRRTLLEAMKRLAATGELDKLHYLPGNTDAMKLITPQNRDRRYRQYKEIPIPSSNAVIMFGRDGSASMTDDKCEIASDIAYWVECYVKRFYKNVQTAFFWHDTVATEVDQEKFYKYRFGGGTRCSSCLKLMAEQLETRFEPSRWNIYVIYFTDGENDDQDNTVFTDIIHQKFPPEVCNLMAITQILPYRYDMSLKKHVDEVMAHVKNVRTCSVGNGLGPSSEEDYWDPAPTLSEEDRNEQVKRAIKQILSANPIIED